MKVEDLGEGMMCMRDRVMVEEGSFYMHDIPHCPESVKLWDTLVIAEQTLFHQCFSSFHG